MTVCNDKSTGVACAKYIEMHVKGHHCVIFIDESENKEVGLLGAIPLRQAISFLASTFSPDNDVTLAFKDLDENWYQIVQSSWGVHAGPIRGAASHCCAIEIPYLIHIEESVV
jgi:hypothetical protein